MMLAIIDVCSMPNCFLFDKFYLHYALCDFDSILLLYIALSYLFAKAQIANKFLTSLLKTLSLKNSAYATVFIYIWQEDVAEIAQVPRAPRNVNPARE